MNGIFLTGVVSEQCARWDCVVRPPTPESVYCRESCLAMATSEAQYTRPIFMSNVYSSATKFADVASKILGSLKTNTASGVPHLSQDLLQTPPWESNVFNVEFTPREDHRQWLFIGLFPIPDSTTSGFKWKGGRAKMIGEVSHRLFKPSPTQGNKWKLHQYSSPDLTGKAVYVMHCNRED